ncbi:ArsR/SmtB family transcription factor [Haladaptatus sp. DFWS20]|uniref:ArsR/SmtB family transcription factor n=1 Tax=Haladaptatus sp. DFWS20 TaxID=3403467 RepID=UPI003EBBE86F
MPDEVQHEEGRHVFPIRWPVAPNDNRPARIHELTDDEATEVFESLSSETARTLLSHLHENPQTASDLAECVGTSVQNVQYHLRKFQEAGLVEVVDNWFSSRGTEMKVYCPTHQSLVLYTGDEPEKTRLGTMLSRLGGAIAILSIMSVVFDRIIRSLGSRSVDHGGNPLPGKGPSPSPDPNTMKIFDIYVPPGVVFFFGGLFILTLGIGWWYWRQ